jgi:diguanylate cyclase (GGDEF)-like protein
LTTALSGISVALALCVVALLVVLPRRSRRAHGAEEERLAAVVAALDERVDGLARGLADAVARAEAEAARGRLLATLAGSIDLDEVLTRTLEAATELPGADAALLTLRGREGKPIVATLGLSAEEAGRHAAAALPEADRARAISVSIRYRDEEDADDLIHGGLAVPVAAEESAPLGVLAIFARARDHAFDDASVGRLEELATRAAPAIDNARRFREARQLADLDALTGLHNRRYFHETLDREVARAHRYGRRLALVVFDLDDFKDVNDRIGHLAGDAVLAELAERVREVVRSADVPCRVGGDEFAVILPESTVGDADQLYARVREAVAARPVGQGGRILLSAGVAELTPQDDATSFFQRADDALYRAKDRGKDRAVAADG